MQWLLDRSSEGCQQNGSARLDTILGVFNLYNNTQTGPAEPAFDGGGLHVRAEGPNIASAKGAKPRPGVRRSGASLGKFSWHL